MKFLLLLYFASPAFAANMAPVLWAKWCLWEWGDHPLDGAKMLRGKRIFGANKTWRGLLSGIFLATVIAVLQYVFSHFGVFPFPELTSVTKSILYGICAGFGALGGDALESFLKRQIGIASGRPFLPFDQIDYILGFLFCTSWLMHWTGAEIIFLLLCGMVLNPIVNLSAYFCGIKKTYW